MSYDRKINQVCTHQVVEEAIFVSEDRLTLHPLRPIASINSVKIRFNRLLDVPSAGVALGAVVKGSLPGPYTVQKDSNDTLVLSVDGNPDQTLILPTGSLLSAKQLAAALNKQTKNVVFSATKKNQLQATTRSQGPSSRIQLRQCNALADLGMTVNKVYRGQQVMPRWSLITDPNTLGDRPTRLIVFDNRIEGSNDFFELNYATVRQECRRCGGSGVENDWRYDGSGEVIKARDTDLLVQEMLKATYTQKGSNPFHPWYGTLIVDAIGKKLVDRGLVQNMIVTDIREAFKRWQSVKQQQEDKVGQFVSDEEFPFQLLSVTLDKDVTDPTVIYVNAVVQSRSSRPIQVSRGLRLPIPFDLLGSSVQDTLLQAEKAKGLKYR